MAALLRLSRSINSRWSSLLAFHCGGWLCEHLVNVMNCRQRDCLILFGTLMGNLGGFGFTALFAGGDQICFYLLIRSFSYDLSYCFRGSDGFYTCIVTSP